MKGVGETGAIASPAAVMNAVIDALAPFGVTDIDMPATPERVWRAIQEARSMIPSTFDYEVAESAEHAVSLLGSREDAKLLAGGHSLIPLLRLRFARPSLLVDIGRIAELSYVRDTGEWLAIGALTRYKALQDDPLSRSTARSSRTPPA